MDHDTLQKAFIATSINYNDVSKDDLTMKAFYRGQKELLVNLMLMEKAGPVDLNSSDKVELKEKDDDR